MGRSAYGRSRPSLSPACRGRREPVAKRRGRQRAAGECVPWAYWRSCFFKSSVSLGERPVNLETLSTGTPSRSMFRATSSLPSSFFHALHLGILFHLVQRNAGIGDHIFHLLQGGFTTEVSARPRRSYPGAPVPPWAISDHTRVGKSGPLSPGAEDARGTGPMAEGAVFGHTAPAFLRQRLQHFAVHPRRQAPTCRGAMCALGLMAKLFL